jgi:hypothetical protein
MHLPYKDSGSAVFYGCTCTLHITKVQTLAVLLGGTHEKDTALDLHLTILRQKT